MFGGFPLRRGVLCNPLFARLLRIELVRVVDVVGSEFRAFLAELSEHHGLFSRVVSGEVRGFWHPFELCCFGHNLLTSLCTRTPPRRVCFGFDAAWRGGVGELIVNGGVHI